MKTELLSANWYKLSKITFSYSHNQGSWQTQSREVYDRGNGAAILLYNPDRKTVVLTRQFRLPTFVNNNESGMLIEACAGLLDDEDPITCIRRETEEETGFRIAHPVKIFEAYMSPGSVTELLHFFIAGYTENMRVDKGGGVVAEQEQIDVMEIDFNNSLSMIDNGEIKDGKTIMLLQYLRLKNIL